MTTPGRTRRREQGLVLVMVLVVGLLLTAGIATFMRSATVDSILVRHRDDAARADALARGGVRLAQVLLLEDRLEEARSGLSVESEADPWALVSGVEIPVSDDGASLRLRIQDAGAKLNLNALIADGKPIGEGNKAELFLTAALQRVIDQMPGRKEDKRYDAGELARNLLDWMDADDVRIGGGAESDPYARRDPPVTPPNRPLLSLDEVRQVAGFDGRLVDELSHYATVYPYGKGGGINPNTAPPHVLGLLYHGVGADLRLVTPDEVGAILKARDNGDLICADDAANPACTRKIGELVAGEIFPPPSFVSNVFHVVAEARVGEIRRTTDAWVDRSKPSQPLLLAWRVR
jgi:type II secretory pathway component PulK